MALLSLCLIMRDERENLPRLLASVRGVVDEVIAVDTGSADGTVEIAAELGARIYLRPWQDDFSLARNAGLDAAGGDWILVLDADEELDRETAAGLRDMLATTGEQRFAVDIVSLVGDGSRRQSAAVTRLFRRLGHRYAGRVHEQIEFNGAPVPPGQPSGLRVTHYGYLAPARGGKVARNITLLNRAWAERPNDYLAYQLGVTHYVGGNPAEALRWFEEAVRLRGGYDPKLLKDTACCLEDLGRHDEALALAKTGTRLYPDYTDLHFLVGTIHIDTGNVKEAEQAFKACLAMGEAPRTGPGRLYNTVEGVGSYLAHYNLGVIYEVSGSAELAACHYREAARAGYRPAAERQQNLGGCSG